MKKVALSGAGGILGSILRKGLLQKGVNLRSAGFEPLQALQQGEDIVHGDLRDPAAVDRMLEGVDVLIHLAGTSVERPMPEIIENNLRALYEVYEGARRHGVKRIVFASSNHAFGMHRTTDKLKLDAPYRPDGLYGLSKEWGEGMAQLYWDKHGIEGISLRIGTCMGKPPENERQLSTWLGSEDALHLAMRCIETEKVSCIAVWGISNNTRAWYDLSEGNAIGYAPQQNAERWAAGILAQPNTMDAVGRTYQGGTFASHDYSRGQPS